MCLRIYWYSAIWWLGATYKLFLLHVFDFVEFMFFVFLARPIKLPMSYILQNSLIKSPLPRHRSKSNHV